MTDQTGRAFTTHRSVAESSAASNTVPLASTWRRADTTTVPIGGMVGARGTRVMEVAMRVDASTDSTHTALRRRRIIAALTIAVAATFGTAGPALADPDGGETERISFAPGTESAT